MADSIEDFKKLLDYIDIVINRDGNDALKREFTYRYCCKSFDPYVEKVMNVFLNQGREFYENISDSSLQSELVFDFANMLWNKTIMDIPEMFVHINFQVENMLNVYANSNKIHKKARRNPDIFYYEMQSNNGKKPFDVKVKDRITWKDNKKVPVQIKDKALKDVDLWTKYAFWFIDSKIIEQWDAKTGRDGKTLGETLKRDYHFLLKDAIDARNYMEHRAHQVLSKSDKDKIDKLTIEWKTKFESENGGRDFDNILRFLSYIKDTL